MKHVNFRLKLGIIILSFFLILGFIVPLFPHEDPIKWGTYYNNLPASTTHLLGTTNLGQDTFWLLTESIRNSFIIGVLVALFATIIGVVIGLIAGFKGGFLDRLITLICDSFIAIPSLPILILLSSMIEGSAPIVYIILLLIVFNWPWPARQARAMALSIKEGDFISTALFSGRSTASIIIKEIFPFVSNWALANFVNTILVAIAAESGLAVIGMSSNSTATLGTMVYWANQHQAMLAGRWLWIGSPVVATALIFIGLFLIMTGYQQYAARKRGNDA